MLEPFVHGAKIQTMQRINEMHWAKNATNRAYLVLGADNPSPSPTQCSGCGASFRGQECPYCGNPKNQQAG